MFCSESTDYQATTEYVLKGHQQVDIRIDSMVSRSSSILQIACTTTAYIPCEVSRQFVKI